MSQTNYTPDITDQDPVDPCTNDNATLLPVCSTGGGGGGGDSVVTGPDEVGTPNDSNPVQIAGVDDDGDVRPVMIGSYEGVVVHDPAIGTETDASADASTDGTVLSRLRYISEQTNGALGILNDISGNQAAATTSLAAIEASTGYLSDINDDTTSIESSVGSIASAVAGVNDTPPPNATQVSGIARTPATLGTYTDGNTAPFQTDLNGRLLVSPYAPSSVDAGYLVYRNTALSNTPATVFAGACNVYGWNFINTNASAVYVKLLNNANVVQRTFLLPLSGSFFMETCTTPQHRATDQLHIKCVTGSADADTTAPVSAIIVDVTYKS